MSVYENIMAGLEESLEHAKQKKTYALRHFILSRYRNIHRKRLKKSGLL